MKQFSNKMILMLFVFLISLSYSITFRRVAEFPSGGSRRAFGFDTDQDGRQNLVFPKYGGGPIQFWEYIDYDRYFLEDSVSPWSVIYDIGYLDADSLVDMVGNNNGWPYPLYVYESPTSNSNPISVVWAKESLFMNIYGSYIADLDQDGNNEMLFRYTDSYTGTWSTCVYENIDDNQYTKVWEDTIHESAFFVNGDFDQDGQIEFVTGGDIGYVYVWECIGNNDYQFIFCDTLPHGNSYDISMAHDMDGNGKPEFMFNSLFGKARLYLYEAADNNIYEYFLVDSIQLPSNWAWAFSVCGDIDADGVEEIVWSTCNNWQVYKAFGVHNYQRIYDGDWTTYQVMEMNVCDLNGNGYPEIIEAHFQNGIPPLHGITLWEIEGVRLYQPNGSEVLHPNQQYLITWDKFDPPGADSFALFYSYDNGFNYDTIVTGLGSSDTSYLWTVPNTISDSCKVMIWAYGPPRPGEQEPRGTAWDFSDALFRIVPVGIEEDASTRVTDFNLGIFQNPANSSNVKIQYSLSQPSFVSLKLYNTVGQLIEILADNFHNAGCFYAEITEPLSEGVYFIKYEYTDQALVEKLIILK